MKLGQLGNRDGLVVDGAGIIHSILFVNVFIKISWNWGARGEFTDIVQHPQICCHAWIDACVRFFTLTLPPSCFDVACELKIQPSPPSFRLINAVNEPPEWKGILVIQLKACVWVCWSLKPSSDTAGFCSYFTPRAFEINSWVIWAYGAKPPRPRMLRLRPSQLSLRLLSSAICGSDAMPSPSDRLRYHS